MQNKQETNHTDFSATVADEGQAYSFADDIHLFDHQLDLIFAVT